MTVSETHTLTDWAGSRGAKWLRDLDAMEAMLAPVGEELLAQAALAPGSTVVDIGSGGGWTSLRAAAAVGPAGRVLGLDISADLVSEATARGAHLPQLSFRAGDAAGESPPEAPFQRLISRFGVMFFPDPAAAWRKLAKLLVPGGRIDVAVWADPARNAWAGELRRVVGNQVALPRPEPLAPGPFQLADAAYLDGILAGAGFTLLDRRISERLLPVGGPGTAPRAAAEFSLRAFGAGEALDGAPAEAREAAVAELESIYARDYLTDNGVAITGTWWLVSARLDS
jgi:SAM-dependent methyltransferase